jgi:D-amino-acid dehydrogenase
MARAPRWLFDPLGPLSVPLGHAPRVAPWLWRFWRASRPDRFRAGIAAQAALMDLSRAETPPLYAAAGAEGMIRTDGALHLYADERELTAALPDWEARRAHGIAFEPVEGPALAALQPGLAASISRAVFVPGWQTVADPFAVARAIAEAATARGAQLRLAEAVRLAADGEGVTVGLADGSSLRGGAAVVAAGAWSHRLATLLGDKVPLETERGYNTTLPCGAFDLRRQIVLDAHGFVITPLASGIRVGGAVELGGLARPPDFRRADAMVAKAAAALPGLRTGGGTRWMGFRPSLPDSLPVIGRAPRAPRVVYAFGHGHLGLTQAAGTARLVDDLLLGRTPAIPLAPYRLDRF